MMKRVFVGLILLAVLLPAVRAQEPKSAIAKYGKLSFPESTGGLDWKEFDKGWKDRVAIESEIINDADLKSLRAALKYDNPMVRSMAARALGILADRAEAGGPRVDL